MKFKRIVIKFRDPLTKDVFYQGKWVKQEDILFADVAGIKKRLRQELEQTLKKTNTWRLINAQIIDSVQVRIKDSITNLQSFMSFNKLSDTEYELLYPFDLESLVDLISILKSTPFFKQLLQNRLVSFNPSVALFQEKKLIEAFEKFTFKEMQLEPSSWSFVVEEVEVSLPHLS